MRETAVWELIGLVPWYTMLLVETDSRVRLSSSCTFPIPKVQLLRTMKAEKKKKWDVGPSLLEEARCRFLSERSYTQVKDDNDVVMDGFHTPNLHSHVSLVETILPAFRKGNASRVVHAPVAADADDVDVDVDVTVDVDDADIDDVHPDDSPTYLFDHNLYSHPPSRVKSSIRHSNYLDDDYWKKQVRILVE